MRDIKDREYLYKMIISQLFYDGYQKDAMPLAQHLGMAGNMPPPSEKLFRWFSIAKKYVEENERAELEEMSSAPSQPTTCLDLEADALATAKTAEPAMYETIYLTAHKQPARAVAFSNDGTLVASGSADCSIKVMDVDRIIARNMTPDEIAMAAATGFEADKQFVDAPVIRTLYDHTDEINCLAFHPRTTILLSGSSDCTVKYYDFSKPAVKRSYRGIQEVHPVQCMAIHPGGDYLMVGVRHPTLRLYNLHTSQAYTGVAPHEQHKSAVNDLAWSHDGRQFVSAGRDGDVKVWDGVSNRCVLTLSRAHNGNEICSAQFTRNGKYVLTAGKDSIVKLWELAVGGRCLVAYTGAGSGGMLQEFNVRAQLNHAEDYVMFPDEKSCSMCSWDARTAERKRLLPLGHNGPVRGFAHSPTQAAFVTASDDFRVRFWYKRH